MYLFISLHSFQEKCHSFPGFMLPHSSEVEPSMEVLKVVVSWIGDTNTDVCMATPPASLVALPSLLRTMPEPSPSHLPTHPVLGLIRWACLLPLLKSVTVLPHDQAERAKHLHSQLQLGILQTLLAAGGDLEKNQDDELEPGEVEDEVDTEHLIVLEDLKELATDMLNLVEILKGDPAVDQDVTEHQTQLAVDRFAQVNQVALTTGCLPCRRGKVWVICQKSKFENFKVLSYSPKPALHPDYTPDYTGVLFGCSTGYYSKAQS